MTDDVLPEGAKEFTKNGYKVLEFEDTEGDRCWVWTDGKRWDRTWTEGAAFISPEFNFPPGPGLLFVANGWLKKQLNTGNVVPLRDSEPPPTERSEVQALKARIAELEARIDELEEPGMFQWELRQDIQEGRHIALPLSFCRHHVRIIAIALYPIGEPYEGEVKIEGNL